MQAVTTGQNIRHKDCFSGINQNIPESGVPFGVRQDYDLVRTENTTTIENWTVR
jgi:hypothetical protein